MFYFIKKLFQLIGKRVATFYTLVFVITLPFVDYEGIRPKYLAQTLNRIRPDFVYLVELVAGRQASDKKQLNPYIYYYHQVAETFPNQADALGLWGYCLYRSGDLKSAKAAYQEALRVMPDFFWFNFNLGLLYFKEQNFSEAERYLNSALISSVDKTMAYIYYSNRIYLPLHTDLSRPDPRQYFTRQIKQGFGRAYFLLALAYYHEKDWENMMNALKAGLSTSVDEPARFYLLAAAGAYELKNYELAFSFVQEALKHDREHWEPWYYLGQTLMAVGKTEEGRKIAEQAEKLKDKNSASYFDVSSMSLEAY